MGIIVFKLSIVESSIISVIGSTLDPAPAPGFPGLLNKLIIFIFKLINA